MSKIRSWLQMWAVNKILGRSFSKANPNNLISEDSKGILYIGKDPIPRETMIGLKEEILVIEKTRMWQILQEQIREKAIETAFTRSQNFDDVKTGKLIIFVLDTFKYFFDKVRETSSDNRGK